MPESPSPPPPAREVYATAALYVATVAVYSDMYATQPVLPMLSAEFHVPPATAGLTVSAVVLAIALSSTFYGPLADAFGRKRVMVLASALLALPTLGCSLASSLGGLVLLRALQGMLIPGMTAVSVAFVGDTYPPARVGAVVGGLIGASVAGGLVGRVGSGWLAAHAGWRAPFVVLAVTTLGSSLLMAWALPRHAASGRSSLGAALAGLGGHLRDRRLVGAFLVGFALFFGFIGIFTYLPYRLSAPPFSLPTGVVSSMYATYIAGVVVSPVAGRLAPSVGSERLMGAGIIIAAAGALTTLSGSLPLIVTGLLVLCVGMFTGQAVAPSYVNRTARTARGGANALYLTFYYVGGTLGSVLPGLAWQRWGWPGVITTCLTAMAVALVSVTTLSRPP